eukprot:gene23189-16996_t
MRLFFHADGHFNIPEGAITIEAGSWKEWGVDGKKAVPDAPTYAAGALYFWWSDPELDAGKGRVLSRSRQQMVWTVMHVALRLETTSTSPELADVLPPEMWMLIMTFVKH